MIKKNKIKFIDLGLPSGILWRDRNLGAYNVESLGNYYRWGEIIDTRTAIKTQYYFSKFYKLDYLKLENDAVRINLGLKYRMPNLKDFKELQKYTYKRWINKKGGILISKINGNSIFLPAAGWIDYLTNEKELIGASGNYWLLDSNTDNRYAYTILIHSSRFNSEPINIQIGCSIRPVYDKKENNNNRHI